jgi:hypothetical protein
MLQITKLVVDTTVNFYRNNSVNPALRSHLSRSRHVEHTLHCRRKEVSSTSVRNKETNFSTHTHLNIKLLLIITEGAYL